MLKHSLQRNKDPPEGILSPIGLLEKEEKRFLFKAIGKEYLILTE